MTEKVKLAEIHMTDRQMAQDWRIYDVLIHSVTEGVFNVVQALHERFPTIVYSVEVREEPRETESMTTWQWLISENGKIPE